jgi:hypothetical protein
MRRCSQACAKRIERDGAELGDRLGDGGERGRWPAGRTAVADQRP